MRMLDPISAGWLALRESADDRARSATEAAMLPRLGAALEDTTGEPGADPGEGAPPVLCIDLGTGTGANPRWLMPRLSFGQRWVLVDHDGELLGELRDRLAEQTAPWEPVVSDVGHLRDVITAHRQPGQAVLVTCAALLDLLDAETVRELARTLADEEAHGLFSLTVDGGWDLDPADPRDEAIRDAFNAHQQRFGHLGPEAIAALEDALTGHDVTVELSQTDWRLDAARPQDRDLMVRLLRDRTEAVRDQLTPADGAATPDPMSDPDLSIPDLDSWLADRVERARAGSLRIRVGHQDVLVLPAG